MPTIGSPSLSKIWPGEYRAPLTSARLLTIYATASRYPDEILEVQQPHLDEAITIATRVVDWARAIVQPA